jgi:hypothetical protein
MQTTRSSFNAVVVQFEAPEVFRILTTLQAQEEQGTLDPALRVLSEKLNEALPFSVPSTKQIIDSD